MAKNILIDKNIDKNIIDFFKRYNHEIKIKFETGNLKLSNDQLDDLWGPETEYTPPPIKQKPIKKEKLEILVGNNKVLLGKPIPPNKITPISTLTSEKIQAIIEGKVFSTDSRVLKTGKTIVSFGITDLSDSITTKCFIPKDETLEIKEGDFLRVKGRTEYDTYIREVVLMCNNINKVKPLRRCDSCEEKRVELHAHSKMSSLDGTTNIDELVELAEHFGHKSISLTDHGIVQGFPKFYAECKKRKIKAILGMEGYLVDEINTDLKFENKKNAQKPYHIIILATNKIGLKN
jgi:DNA polymerase-3 subunit alpha (Gram-positive type)